MKRNKVIIRKIATMVLICGLAFLAAGAAAADDAPQKGFVLFGLSQLYDGTDQIHGGMGELIDGNRKLVDGLDTLGGALDEDIAGNLQTMKTGIDGQILPGLGDILAGISGKIVPGLGDMKSAVDGQMVPGLGDILAGINGQIVPGIGGVRAGLAGQMSPGLGAVLAAIEGKMVPGLFDVRDGLKDQIGPGLGKLIAGVVKVDENEEEPGLIQGLNLVSSGIDQIKTGVKGQKDLMAQSALPLLGEPGKTTEGKMAENVNDVVQIALQDISAMGENPPANLWQDTLFAVQTVALYIPDSSASWTAEESLISKVVGTYVAINNIKALQEYGKPVIIGIDEVSRDFIIQPTAQTPYYAALLGGLDEAKAGVGKIRDGIAALDGEGKPKVTVDAEGNPDTLYAGLAALKTGINSLMVPGLTAIGEGLEKEIAPGLREIKAGMDTQMVPGLDKLSAGLSGDISGGLTQIRGGLKDQFSPGLGEMLTGFNKTEAVTGQSGVIEGLTKISDGLANPEFSPNPGGDPGVSDGLGLVIDGIRTDVLDGIDELKGGIVAKIIPGLEQMSTGISGELQPGFTKVSWLLLGIWLVTLVVFLVVGIFIGRARGARASSSRSASL